MIDSARDLRSVQIVDAGAGTQVILEGLAVLPQIVPEPREPPPFSGAELLGESRGTRDYRPLAVSDAREMVA
jgi:hypothetical protein